ncbi:MAG TPA: isopentenyl-diphosphate Delta-isomerase, partial [Candidatus Parcubacteria bacterium]|nr:isopentenyl-diphosphate Delta-isomerase [Candidatus Parcubacteria bacterium]
MDKLILVNNKDKIIGYETKEKCHQGKGILHRAFSIYIFDDNDRLLIQQRSRFKKLWPFYWANSCCSHPRKNENYVEAGERRMVEELGFTVPLEMIAKIQYFAQYKNVGSEREMLALLIGHYHGEKVKVNPKEIANWKWAKIEDVLLDFKKRPEKYAPWFKLGLKK